MQSMSDLPDDIEILKQIVIEQRGRLLSNTLQIEQLKLQLAKLRRIQFGRSSEQIDAQIAQLELILKISKFDPQRRHSRSLQRCLNG
jgi:transposase